ncbi:helix-turn-helix transcriptional regulator [Cohnella terricola]|uniref:Helix-turn-helix domain-containing protein n=1 Tax=Cohnella terricola TaxID=1289167 RepID=A0A559JT01_9BACL|nr:AraC family transcriptional regulator [Cohnella terricola]TVY03006.1 helix-turn-helix domain-containing protein [Cohnella terricola]
MRIPVAGGANIELGEQTQATSALRSALNLPAIRVLGDFIKKPGTGLVEREIPDYEVLYFPEGTDSVYRVGQREYVLSQPCFVLTRPGEIHSYTYDAHKPTRHLFIHFWLKSFPGDMLPMLLPNGPAVIPYQGELLYSLMKQINAIAYLNPDRLQDRGSLLLLSLLSEIDSLAANEPSKQSLNRLPPQLTKALDIIELSLSSSLTVEILAKRVGWTPEHLSRSFARFLGMTPKETIMRRRIERACQLLLYGQQSVKEIAFEVGFTDENYFCRVFKAMKAITATDYRVKYYNPRHGDLAPVNDGEALYPSNRIFFGEP